MTYRISLQDAYKGYTLDLDKYIAPDETVRRFRERLREVNLDILESTRRIDNGRLNIPVYFSICGEDAKGVIGTKKQMGKGATAQQAEASAVMELTERFSFFSFYRNAENFVTGTYGEMPGPLLPFDAIALSVHDDSEDLDRAREVFAQLPLKWTRAYNLTRDREVLIPFEWFYAINEFNGPSAGNCAEEALLQGVCEVVERHVSSIVSRLRVTTPAIESESVTDPVVRDMIDKYRRAGVKLFISDFSLDTGIPSVGVLAYDPATFPDASEIVWTAGTSPDPQKALSRALSEVAQLGGDFNTGSNYVASGLPKFGRLEEAAFVTEAERRIGIDQLPNLSHDNIRIEVENCIAALDRSGLEVIVVDTTHPRLAIPAFYTIVPGAHFRERAAGTSVGMFAAKIVSQGDDPRRAIAELRRMDALLPNKYYIKFYLGSCYLNMDAPQEALGFFEEAMALEPGTEEIVSIYSYTAVCLKDLGRYRQALELLQKAERLDSERPDVYNLMGFCYFKLKEHANAIDAFERVLKLNPASAIDYANIASNYRDLGDRTNAIRYYRLALELDSSIEFAWENLLRLEDAK